MLRIPTTSEVWFTMLRVHANKLELRETFSNPDGSAFGGCGDRGEMMTQWGFPGAKHAFMEARTTYDIEYTTRMGQLIPCRAKEVHLYWLLVTPEEQ